VNITPKTIVKRRPRIALGLSPERIAWCDQVTVAPEDTRIAVFKRGTSNGSNTLIPTGGQIDPMLISGPKALWKNPQKNEKKKHTSDRINNIIPICNPFCTANVWCPWNEASLITSLHQTIITKMIKLNPAKVSKEPPSYLWKYKTEPDVRAKVPIEPT